MEVWRSAYTGHSQARSRDSTADRRIARRFTDTKVSCNRPRCTAMTSPRERRGHFILHHAPSTLEGMPCGGCSTEARTAFEFPCLSAAEVDAFLTGTHHVCCTAMGLSKYRLRRSF